MLDISTCLFAAAMRRCRSPVAAAAANFSPRYARLRQRHDAVSPAALDAVTSLHVTRYAMFMRIACAMPAHSSGAPAAAQCATVREAGASASVAMMRRAR